MTHRGRLQDASRFVMILLVAAGVAFVVARLQSPDDDASNAISSAAPVALDQRTTVSLATVSVQPVLSGDGRVVPGPDDDTWIIEAPVSPADQAYRLIDDPVGVRARILGGPSGFDCTWLPLGVGPDGAVAMRCLIPDDIAAVEGLTATIVLQLEEPMEVTALPLTAVVGSATQGQVIEVTPDGRMDVRDVELGISDTFNVEVVSGLSTDDAVLAAPIQRDFADAQQ